MGWGGGSGPGEGTANGEYQIGVKTYQELGLGGVRSGSDRNNAQRENMWPGQLLGTV